MRSEGTVHVDVHRHGLTSPRATSDRDILAAEAPLSIVLHHRDRGRPARTRLSVTMRTPGDDPELIAGFLYTEGLIRHRDDIVALAHCGPPDDPDSAARVELAEAAPVVDLERLQRSTIASASCGVCGRREVDVTTLPAFGPSPHLPHIRADVIRALPGALHDAQVLFASTGGMHAAALFTPSGVLLRLREDVGRHNALDKLIGAELLAGALPLREQVLLLSGRVSYELVQKALMAGIGIICAIGAPSSLAVSHAERGGVALVGFLREGRFTIYTGRDRVMDD